jgi:hypothetical protein
MWWSDMVLAFKLVSMAESRVSDLFHYLLLLLTYLFIFICAYNAWFISSPLPHPFPYPHTNLLPLPCTPLLPGRNYFALISNFVVARA